MICMAFFFVLDNLFLFFFISAVRPDQINLLLLGFSGPKTGPTDRNKNNLMSVAIGHNSINQKATHNILEVLHVLTH